MQHAQPVGTMLHTFYAWPVGASRCVVQEWKEGRRGVVFWQPAWAAEGANHAPAAAEGVCTGSLKAQARL